MWPVQSPSIMAVAEHLAATWPYQIIEDPAIKSGQIFIYARVNEIRVNPDARTRMCSGDVGWNNDAPR